MKRCMIYLMLALLSVSVNCQPEQPEELRGVWLTNVDSEVLNSRASIAGAMQFLADHHFNVVYPVVWNKAFTLYPSAVMDSLFGERIDSLHIGRDPLQELLEEAHARGIAVIPWFEYGFAASYQKNGGRILKQKPHWAARDNRGKLLIKNGFEWLNPYHPEVQDLLLSLMREVARNYDVDGVQGDDRLPAHPVEGGYSAYTDSLYRAAHHGNPPPKNYRDHAWQRWRADQLNAFARRVYDEIKKIKPGLLVSWAPSVYPWSYDEYLQDWPNWLRGGYADQVIPQAYRYDIALYRETIGEIIAQRDQLPAAVGARIYPGVLMNVGEYVIPPDFLVEALAYHRAQGFRGEVFFFYEGLRKNNGALAKLLREKFYQTPARVPWK